MSIELCRVIDLPSFSDVRGSLTYIEGSNHIPFDIQRIYYLYAVPERAERGAHAHKALHQFVVAVSGSFDIVLDDGSKRKRIHLDRPELGLYIVPMMWRSLDNFSPGAVCCVLASARYDESDYIRDHREFLRAVRGGSD